MAEFSAINLIRPDWPAPANIRAFTTTRQGGFSQGAWSSLNLGSNCGDNPLHVQQNRDALTGILPAEPRWLNQVHGTNVVSWDKAGCSRPEADAIISSQPQQVCAVLHADCLPVLFCNRDGTRIGAAHAGWRGLSAGVLEATVTGMGCKPDELIAWLGPAIGPRAFEVGSDVYDRFIGLNPGNTLAFTPHRDRWYANIYQLATLALTRAGIRQIYGGQYCTYTEEDKFFSYRRVGESGRMATIAWLE